MEALKRHWRSLLPSRLSELCRRRGGRAVFSGNFPDWQAAAAAASGYDDAAILERVAAATREVVAGRAVFERDSRLFREPEPNYPLIAALALSADGDGLRVLDFGGALGSAYFQNRSWLRELGALEWTVVEQPHFVACGQREFTTGELRFAFSIGEALAAGGLTRCCFPVSAISSRPWAVWRLALRGTGIGADRTPLVGNGRWIAARTPALYGGLPGAFPGEALHDALAEKLAGDGFDSYEGVELPGERRRSVIGRSLEASRCGSLTAPTAPDRSCWPAPIFFTPFLVLRLFVRVATGAKRSR